jgi:hypothetical protein
VQAGAHTTSGSSRQQGMKAPQNDLWTDFDSNQDGVLEPAEFQALLQVGTSAWLTTCSGAAQRKSNCDTSHCSLTVHMPLCYMQSS